MKPDTRYSAYDIVSAWSVLGIKRNIQALESNNVHPGDIEILCGNEMMCRYEHWIYFNIK